MLAVSTLATASVDGSSAVDVDVKIILLVNRRPKSMLL